jgi:putative ABC transport system permease protein
MLSVQLATRYARQRPARTLVAALGITAGVAGLQAISLGTQGTLESVRLAYEEAAGPAALVVVPAGDTLAALPADALKTIEHTEGVESLLPSVQAPSTRVEDLSSWTAPLFPGEVSGVLVIGLDFAREDNRGRFHVSEGDAHGALAGERWASERHIRPGDSVRLVAGDGVLELRVSGLLSRDGLGARNGGQVILAPIADVRRGFGMAPDEVTEASLVLSEPANVDQMVAELRQRLGDGVSVLKPSQRGQDIVQRLGTVRAGTDLTSSIALFLASFLVYAMYATAAAERTRDTALFRCIGATRLQAARALVVEAALVAVPASALGAGLGSFLARGVSAALAVTAGAELRVPRPHAEGMVISAAVGVVVAIASALLPALRGARQDPFEAIRARAAAVESPSGRVTALWALLCATSLTLLLLYPPRESATARTYLLVLGLIGGAAGVLPSLLMPITRAAGRASLGLLGGGVALGVAAPRWRPIRSGLASGAVLGCVAMVGAVSALSSGFRTQMSDWADRALGWDLFVRRPSGLDEAALAQVRRTPGVRYTSPVYIRPAVITIPGGKEAHLSVVGVDPEVYAEDGAFFFAPGTQGNPAALLRSLEDGKHALVTGVLSGQLGLRVGSTVTLQSPFGPREVQLVAEVVDYTQNGFAVITSAELLRKAWWAHGADLATVRLEPGADVATVTVALSAIPGVQVESRARLKERVMAAVNGSLSSLNGLLWLSALVAFLSIWAVVALGAIERRADIALLRSVGMSRGQVVGMICAEAILTAAVGALLGFGLGIYLGWVFTESTHRLGFPVPFHVPWGGLSMTAALAILSALPAALLPALRAAAVPPAEALRDV